MLYGDPDRALATWFSTEYALTLYRVSYQNAFRLVVESTRSSISLGWPSSKRPVWTHWKSRSAKWPGSARRQRPRGPPTKKPSG